MWGWTVENQRRNGHGAENPTYVGMDRQPGLHTMTPGRKPHVCGDGPIRNRIIQEAQSKTPRMWGWTDFPSGMGEAWHENPTYVGMDRPSATNREKSWRKPHVCGDGPLKDMEELVDQIVNPTYVGMDRSCPEYDPEPKRKPHVCGDGPKMEILRAIFDQ